jgi:hypothetical protein
MEYLSDILKVEGGMDGDGGSEIKDEDNGTDGEVSGGDRAGGDFCDCLFLWSVE